MRYVQAWLADLAMKVFKGASLSSIVLALLQHQACHVTRSCMQVVLLVQKEGFRNTPGCLHQMACCAEARPGAAEQFL